MSGDLSWIPIYEELARKLLEFRHNREPLVRLVYDNAVIGPCVGYLHMEDGSPFRDIDPFSFFAIFNRARDEQRLAILGELKRALNLQSPLPGGFDGVPKINPMSSFFLLWQDENRARESAETLWGFFEALMQGTVDEERFAQLLDQDGIGAPKLTIPMFWVAPGRFLPLDGKTTAYLEQHGVELPKVRSYADYAGVLETVRAQMASGEIKEPSFAHLSVAAYQNGRSEGLLELRLEQSPDGVYRLELDISKDEWIAVLQAADLPKEQLDAILKFYAEPGHKGSCKRVGDKYGINPQVLNINVTHFGRFAQRKLNRFVVRNADGKGFSYWSTPVKEGRHVDGFFEWTLRDELVAAIEALGLGNAREYYVVSPNFHFDVDQDLEGRIRFMKEEQVIACGWLQGKTADRFRQMKAGDRIICAQRVKRQWQYHFAGTIRAAEQPEVVPWCSFSGRLPDNQGFEQMPTADLARHLADRRMIDDMDVLENREGLDITLRRDIQYWRLDNFRLLGEEANGLLDGWTGNGKNQIGTLERVKNENGENAEVVSRIEALVGANAPKQEEVAMTAMERKVLELVRSRKNVVLHGAPGTGKTYLALAVAKAMGCRADEIKKVQFHPSYDYTDFVEGLRPVSGEDGQVGFERRDGVFKAFCKRALSARRVAGQDNFEEAWGRLLDWLEEKGPIELTLARGGAHVLELNERGDGLVGRVPEGKWFYKWSKNRIYKAYLGESKFRNNYKKPILEWMERNVGLVAYEEGTRIEASEARPFVFIIDEINRGDLSKIFGELFGAIEQGYRGETGRVETQYQNLVPEGDEFAEGFFVPENVYVIGTMNDIDRNVESMDFAMRRRFAWEEVTPEDTAEAMFAKCLPEWKDEALSRMRSLNAAIGDTRNLGREFAIGPACFLPLEREGGDFEGLWRHHIEGTLREYLRGMSACSETLEGLKRAYQLEQSDEA
ncbi:MAG: AAA family ATPase [Kiritimatiellia bacterium]